jgi:hypothetical protein
MLAHAERLLQGFERAPSGTSLSGTSPSGIHATRADGGRPPSGVSAGRPGRPIRRRRERQRLPRRLQQPRGDADLQWGGSAVV